jgi:hypothetical protein
MRDWKPALIIGGIALMIGSFVLLIFGQMIGLLTLLTGAGLTFTYVFLMMRGAGYHPTSASLADGDAFPGRQQSQVARDQSIPVMDEKPVNIWDKMGQNKK